MKGPSPHESGWLLDVRDLTVEFPLPGRARLRALDGVSVNVSRAETVGVVGESGSGKTTLGRAILGLEPCQAGEIWFDNANVTNADRRTRRMLSSRLQVVFQNPYGSLNPTRTVGQTLREMLKPLDVSRAQADQRAAELLERVGLPASSSRRYPGSFSGGQRQRIAIARALMVQPELVICDEPVSALDLSVQAQVLNLLQDLQDEFGLSYLFVAHDLTVVRHVCHRVVVLYRGQIMEEGRPEEVCEAPLHPYTQALLGAAPVADPDVQRRRRELRRAKLAPALSLPTAVPAGCPFAPRCPHAIDVCLAQRPPLELTSTGGFVACHRWREIPREHEVGEAPSGFPRGEATPCRVPPREGSVSC